MTRIRLLLGEMPNLLRDLLRDAVARAADIDLVADVEAADAVEHAIQRHTPDVVVVAPAPEDALRALGLLRVAPHVRVLSIVAGGENATIYELHPLRSPLVDVSMRTVLDAIRAEHAFSIVMPGAS